MDQSDFDVSSIYIIGLVTPCPPPPSLSLGRAYKGKRGKTGKRGKEERKGKEGREEREER